MGGSGVIKVSQEIHATNNAPKAFEIHVLKGHKNKKLREHDIKRNTSDGFAAEASIIAFPKIELCFGFEFNSSCFSFSTASASVP